MKKKCCVVPCLIGIGAIVIGYHLGKHYYYKSLGQEKICCCKKG